jgi:serine/threonine-protein kinase RsbW
MTSAERSLPNSEGDDAADTERVELSIPARPELLFLARMTAAAVASRADFGIDQVEDIRLAIDELCITLAGEDGAEGSVHLVFEWTDDVVEVMGKLVPRSGEVHGGSSTRSAAQALPTLNELSERILEALVDEHGTASVDGAPRAWIRVRRRANTEA